MRKTIALPIMILAVALGYVLGWTMKANSIDTDKWTPDTINIYAKDKTMELTAASFPDLYKKVTRLIVFDELKKVAGGEPPVSADDIVEMKKNAIEYVYNKPISIQMSDYDGNVKTIKFTEILFPIYDNGETPVYIRTTDDVYLFLEHRSSLQWMVKTI
ncbi:hypothetical protein DFQ01_12553 [Paenibacillus cellulosilyticus]|uniref:Uncharacterized protein n=1 Tax=Paenibacillus cellulosilyticus TaxID=375489 RepID=A0A2V2YR28_9BACL|nr:hypothetical protein [Paenibacillus cellulosilyticus]PWV95708.1 hypothetical protein DFQ01_12553 [Paenibacillus cellulosilyticus]QKS47658.1 hypothetical protein HUB94_25180 [Paenibacillus cellulosilyticus]